MEESFGKKERKERKKEAREKTEAENQKRILLKKILKIVLAILVALSLGYGLFYFIKSLSPSGPDLSRAVEVLQSREHVVPGTAITIYNSNPPTSGPHYPEPTSRGVHNEEVQDEIMVHDLEHGEVWISYKPSIPDSAKEELKKITGSFSKVVLTPRAKNDSDIALAAWGRLDTFNLEGKPLDTRRVKDFIGRYRNLGPELVP